MKAWSDLTEREVLAPAIARKAEDSRISRSFAEQTRAAFPASAALLDDMAQEERRHRDDLNAACRGRFGEHWPPVRREDVKGPSRRRRVAGPPSA